MKCIFNFKINFIIILKFIDLVEYNKSNGALLKLFPYDKRRGQSLYERNQFPPWYYAAEMGLQGFTRMKKTMKRLYLKNNLKKKLCDRFIYSLKRLGIKIVI